MAKFDWTDEHKTELARLWQQEGLSASLIGLKFGGLSRNAIIGKLHRMGLCGVHQPRNKVQSNRKRSHAPKPKPACHSKPKPKPKPETPEDDPYPMQYRKTFFELINTSCRYPIGAGQFCGIPEANVNNNRPYCPRCAALCWRAYG